MDISPIAIRLRIANSPSQLASNPPCTSLWKTGNLAHTTTTEEEKTRVAQLQPHRNEAPAPLSGDDSGNNDGPPPPRRLLPRKRKSTVERLQALCPDMFDPSRAKAEDCKPSPSLLVDQLQSLGSSTLPNPKRAKLCSSSPPSDGDLTMEAYLDLCHIQPGNTQTHTAIERHSLYHWSIFKTTSIQRLCKLGIRYGPAVLLKGGVHEAMKRLHQD
ncbi:hypothetical protein PTTG_27489 [Puccinia triticina 1-1 BBBD Race 1]|uniref:Uncharacterized protein n=1 Tax=Puccinia triticina (isolate 1-1 / race 1 (BBBD)) TaxID=630390 RepID=A0A180GJY1_PUCT1|nr:hypothetical protein PTTG_27489 [Puccinia triticina 1-1 BBBD Race 1]